MILSSKEISKLKKIEDKDELIEATERKVLAEIYDTNLNHLERESLIYRVSIVKHKGKTEFFHNAVLPFNYSLFDWIGSSFNTRIESILNYALTLADLPDGLHCLSGIITVQQLSDGSNNFESTTRVVPTQYIKLDPKDLPVIYEDPTINLNSFSGLLGEYLRDIQTTT